MRNYGDNPDPEEERYEKFLSNRIYWRNKKKTQLERDASDDNLEEIIMSSSLRKSFLDDSSKVDLDVEKDVDIKIVMMQKYFPEKYGEKGSTPVSTFTNIRIGYLFRGLINQLKP